MADITGLPMVFQVKLNRVHSDFLRCHICCLLNGIGQGQVTHTAHTPCRQ